MGLAATRPPGAPAGCLPPEVLSSWSQGGAIDPTIGGCFVSQPTQSASFHVLKARSCSNHPLARGASRTSGTCFEWHAIHGARWTATAGIARRSGEGRRKHSGRLRRP